MYIFKVVSDSMEPLIRIGAELSVRHINKDYKLKRFDIIIFKSELGLTCHYFWSANINLDKGFIVTRSLKKSCCDIPFSRDLVIGLVKNFKIGKILKFKIFIYDIFMNHF